MAQMIHALLLGMLPTYCSLLESPKCINCKPDLLFNPERKTWIGALTHCQEMQRKLVVINNNSMKTCVNSCLKSRKSNQISKGVWIGLERSIFGCQVPWMWVSGDKYKEETLTDMANQANSSHYCGKITWSKGDGVKFRSGYCFDKLPFICM